MKVLLKFEIDTDADAAWLAMRSPATLAEIYAPFVTLEQLDDGDDAADGDDADADDTPAAAPGTRPTSMAVQLRLFDLIPIGRQLISLSERTVGEPGGDVRILRDSGIPLTGSLASLDVWDHQMAVSPSPNDPRRAIWRDRLVIAGPAAPLLWPVLWVLWQWRQRRIRSIARTWAHD